MAASFVVDSSYKQAMDNSPWNPPGENTLMDGHENAFEPLMDGLEKLNSALDALRREANQKDDLLRIASHDLLSPANSIAGLTKLLLKPDSVSNLTDRQLKILKTMDAAMDGYLNTLGSISELSRILRNKVVLKKERTPLDPILRRAVEAVSQRAAERGISVNMESAGGVEAMADAEAAYKQIMRLLTNAVMFTQNGGMVEVILKNDGPMAALEVRDNGVGIEKSRLDRVFHLCECNNTFGAGGEKGSGMSLCIAKKMAALGGGDLTIESEPGKGTVARLTFPKE